LFFFTDFLNVNTIHNYPPWVLIVLVADFGQHRVNCCEANTDLPLALSLLNCTCQTLYFFCLTTQPSCHEPMCHAVCILYLDSKTLPLAAVTSVTLNVGQHFANAKVYFFFHAPRPRFKLYLETHTRSLIDFKKITMISLIFS